MRHIRRKMAVDRTVIHCTQRTHISGNCIPATVPATQIRFETFKKLLTYFPERKLITSMKGKDCTQATPVNMGGPIIPTFLKDTFMEKAVPLPTLLSPVFFVFLFSKY